MDLAISWQMWQRACAMCIGWSDEYIDGSYVSDSCICSNLGLSAWLQNHLLW